MNYKDITDKQIVDFLTKLKSKPKDDRQDYYDDNFLNNINLSDDE